MRGVNHLRFLPVLSLGVLMGSLCFAGGLTIKDAPTWVNVGTSFAKAKGHRLFQGVGLAPPMGDDALQKATARRRAKTELERLLSDYLEAMADDYQRKNKDPKDSFKIMEETVLPEAEPAAEWRDRRTGTLYVLFRLDLETMKDSIADNQGILPAVQEYVKKRGNKLFDRVRVRHDR